MNEQKNEYVSAPVPFAQFWLDNAKEGDETATGPLLAVLSAGARDGSLNFALRDFLSSALSAIARAAPGAERAKVTKRVLLLGRRPGRKSKYQARQERLNLAREVWDEVGNATGEKLAAGLERISERSGASLRLVAQAHREYLPAFLAERAAARMPSQTSIELSALTSEMQAHASQTAEIAKGDTPNTAEFPSELAFLLGD